MSDVRAAFFFGSGISRGAGAPMVHEITSNLLDGAWQPHTDERFYPVDPSDGLGSIGDAKRSQDFLWIIKDQIDSHLLAREGRTCHYEDLFSSVHQIVQDEKAEVTNPLIARSVEWIKASSSHLYVGRPSHIDAN